MTEEARLHCTAVVLGEHVFLEPVNKLLACCAIIICQFKDDPNIDVMPLAVACDIMTEHVNDHKECTKQISNLIKANEIDDMEVMPLMLKSNDLTDKLQADIDNVMKAYDIIKSKLGPEWFN